MIAITNSFTYIRRDTRGKPYTMKVNFTTMPQSNEISLGDPADLIAVTVIEVDEESGYQEYFKYYIRETKGEFFIGRIKNQRFDLIQSEFFDELKQQVLERYHDIVRNII